MENFSIPVVDLSDFATEDQSRRNRFIESVGRSLTEVGFFALTQHGIDENLIADAYRVTAEFFNLPEDCKNGYEDLKINGQRGYTSFGREHAKDHDAPDLKEFWHVGQELAPGHPLAKTYPANIWPAEVGDFKPTMLKLYQGLESCAASILEACALYIQEPHDRFAETAREGNSILRLIHYPPVPEDRNPASVRAAAHEDINLITLLVDATAAGLEILDRDGNWLPVVTPKGCIIVDSGDMLQNITNGFYKATTHRVVNPNNSRERRYSMPFFVHARSEVSLNPLPSCVDRTGGDQVFPNITAGDFLAQRLAEIGLS